MKIKVVTAVWCHACLLMKKRIKLLKARRPDLDFEFIDLDFEEEKLAGLEIGKVLPVYFVEQASGTFRRFVGEKTEQELETLIDEKA